MNLKIDLKIDRMTECALDAALEEPLKTRWEQLAKQELQSAGGDRDMATVRLTRSLRKAVQEDANAALPDGFYKDVLLQGIDSISYFTLAEFLIGAAGAASAD